MRPDVGTDIKDADRSVWSPAPGQAREVVGIVNDDFQHWQIGAWCSRSTEGRSCSAPERKVLREEAACLGEMSASNYRGDLEPIAAAARDLDGREKLWHSDRGE